MKRIKMILVALVAVAAMGAVGASSASAGSVDMTISGSVFGTPITPCEATMTTTGGPPPASTTLVGSSFVGKAGSPNPCDPASLSINNDPVASFSGSGPWTATLNRVDVTDNAITGCTFVATNTTLTSTVSVNGGYNGSDSATGCGFIPATINISDAVFY